MSTLSGAETARKRFLLWEMGFPDAKISTRSRRARRFCRFPKSSKSVGLGRLENPLGFQPSRRERFSCERAVALSRSPGGWGCVDQQAAYSSAGSAALSRSPGGLGRWTGCFSFEKGISLWKNIAIPQCSPLGFSVRLRAASFFRRAAFFVASGRKMW